MSIKLKSRSPLWPSCEFCGQRLKIMDVPPEMAASGFPSIPMPCDCPEATRHREQAALHEAEQVEQAHRLAEREKADRCIGMSGVGLRYRDAAVPAKVLEAWSGREDQSVGLYITGPVGVGKTYAAAALVLQTCRDRQRAWLIDSIGLLNAIKAEFGQHISGTSTLDLATTVDLLAIDDLGKEGATDWALSQLYKVVNDRYNNMLPTIITTQYADAELLRRWKMDPTGEAMISRFHEAFTRFAIAGKDRRSA